jgi:hypothetical protein
MSRPPDFTPALGANAVLRRAIAAFTRERAWRPRLVAQIAPRAGRSIVDVGCAPARSPG